MSGLYWRTGRDCRYSEVRRGMGASGDIVGLLGVLKLIGSIRV